MNVKLLYQMQKELDSHIESQHNLQSENLIDRKILALLVELGELANETRCFKFWSKRPSSSEQVVLEEFVDGLHFILSLGIAFGFGRDSLHIENKQLGRTAVDQFLEIYKTISSLQHNPTQAIYEKLFIEYIELGQILGFSFEQVMQAYISKNEVNFKRQEQGY